MNRGRWLPVFLVLAIPNLAHFLFSALGFNPTDDGFVLSYARRVLEGQVPHRDFISIRPVLSAYLHVPEVALGGARTYWLSRWLVWIEFGLIAWCWVLAFARASGRAIGVREALAVGSTGFALSVHTFPIMAWHTIDGLALISIGVVLAAGASARGRIAGLVLIGAAALCKQSYLPAALLAPLALGMAGRAAWIAVLLPAALYAASLGFAGAWQDAVQQLSARTDWFAHGLLPLLRSWSAWAGAIVGAAWALVAHDGAEDRERAPTASWWPSLLVAIAVVAASAAVATGVWSGWPSFALFGLAGGRVLGSLARMVRSGGTLRAIPGFERIGVLALLAAFSLSISVGLASPALGAAALAPLAIFSLSPSRRRPAILLAAALVALGGLAFARLRHVYRDLPAARLTRRLDRVFPGAAGLRTGPNTYWFLADLQAAIGRDPRPFTIIPDVAGYWASARARNPLSIDWPQSTELSSPALLERVTRELDARRGHLRVMVQKVEARVLAERFVRLRTRDYPLVEHVQGAWRKVGETEFFEIYE